MTDSRGGASEPEPFCEDVSGVRLPDAGPSLFACGLKENWGEQNNRIWNPSLSLSKNRERATPGALQLKKYRMQRGGRAPGVPTIIFL